MQHLLLLAQSSVQIVQVSASSYDNQFWVFTGQIVFNKSRILIAEGNFCIRQRTGSGVILPMTQIIAQKHAKQYLLISA
jgi:hypothetical protein